MTPVVELALNNIVSIASALIMFGTALFAYLNGKKTIADLTTAGVITGAGVFFLSHVIGVNASDPIASQTAFMGLLCCFFMGMFQVHTTLAYIGKTKERRWLLRLTYAVGLFFVILFLIYPDLLWLPSRPKMYFPNYYVPGPLSWVRIAYLNIFAFGYALYQLISYRRTIRSETERNRAAVIIWTICAVYVVAFIPNFLVYNIPIDPLWGMLFAFVYVVPFLYGGVRYELYNIHVVAKEALFYAVAVVGVGGLVIVLNAAARQIEETNPLFPAWAVPLLIGLIVVTTSILIWRNLRKSDLLKYEFITVVTHKFRTPLTEMKWAAEILAKEPLSSDGRAQIGYLESANTKLLELTNLLVNLSGTESGSYRYDLSRADLSEVADEAAGAVQSLFKAKNVAFTKSLEPGLFAMLDAPRLKFVIQTLLENAAHYAPDRAAVTLIAFREGGNVLCRVSDNGIGITAQELPFVFTKFYRGKHARLADTEGLGIGLYISKEIIAEHGGKISVASPGENRGAIFSFSLPAA